MLVPLSGELAPAPSRVDAPSTKTNQAQTIEKPSAQPFSGQELIRELEITEAGDWFVVLGAFSQANRAERFRRDMQTDLRAVATIVEGGEGGAVHRVAVGPFSTLKNADEARVLLRRQYPTAWIVQGTP